ncbi:hypothetical protein GQ457_08G034060 [Hibiscus cannabinus]
MRSSSRKKTFVTTWTDEESSNKNEQVKLCFMAIQDDKVSLNSSISNSYTFDDLQDAYDELVLEFKTSISKRKKLLSKINLENEILSKTNLELEAKFKDFEKEILDLKNLLHKV